MGKSDIFPVQFKLIPWNIRRQYQSYNYKQ